MLRGNTLTIARARSCSSTSNIAMRTVLGEEGRQRRMMQTSATMHTGLMSHSAERLLPSSFAQVRVHIRMRSVLWNIPGTRRMMDMKFVLPSSAAITTKERISAPVNNAQQHAVRVGNSARSGAERCFVVQYRQIPIPTLISVAIQRANTSIPTFLKIIKKPGSPGWIR